MRCILELIWVMESKVAIYYSVYESVHTEQAYIIKGSMVMQYKNIYFYMNRNTDGKNWLLGREIAGASDPDTTNTVSMTDGLKGARNEIYSVMEMHCIGKVEH